MINEGIMKIFLMILISVCFMTSSLVFAQNSDDFQIIEPAGFRNTSMTRNHHFGFWGPSLSHRRNLSMWNHPWGWRYHDPFFHRHPFYTRPVVRVVNVTPPDPFRYERERERIENAREARRNIALITVSNARFRRIFSSSAAPAPVAEVTVVNNSDLTLSQIFFRGRIETHITNRVLIDDVFSYALPRHLAPGERAVYRIPLSSFSNWTSIRPPDMAVFTVTVMGVVTSSGEIVRN